ncbi:MAG: BlaI/MecI/CopY family transcriptional regulator [Ruminococcaceae bacterium]|nr:BlaI/MecI/CopY family transcriptional regulator [Oscillospiraceae bacterium]
MFEKEIFESEYKFCLILWENEPIPSGELVRLCAEGLGWKKSTTYTVIKRLSERGVLVSENGIVRALVSRDEVQTAESEKFLARTFGGSLPSFIAAFSRSNALSKKDIDELRRMIDLYEEKGEGK